MHLLPHRSWLDSRRLLTGLVSITEARRHCSVGVGILTGLTGRPDMSGAMIVSQTAEAVRRGVAPSYSYPFGR